MFETLTPAGMSAAALIAPPGPSCVEALAAIDPRGLSDSARVDLLIAWQRQSSWVASCLQPVLAAVGDAVEAAAKVWLDPKDPADMPLRAAHAEIGTALRMPDSKAADWLKTARRLTRELPTVQAALAAGDLTYLHAEAIVDATKWPTVEKGRWVAERVLGRARHQTVGRLRRCLKRAVVAADPESAADRARKAHADRSLRWWPLDDGMAELRLITSATDVMTVYEAADAIAQRHKAAGPPPGSDDYLPIDALRADALIDLVVGGAPAPRPAAVNVTIDLPTLLGLADNPGELAGYGPLPAPLARTLAADGRWRRMVLDPMTGALLDLGHTRYRPSEALARFVRTRDRSCAFPTCNRAAHRCEVEHRQPFRPGDPAGGRTDRANLRPMCAGHHKVKHKGGWRLSANPSNGGVTWTSPTGHPYDVEPEDHRPVATFEATRETSTATD